jgi:hypothetical protein
MGWHISNSGTGVLHIFMFLYHIKSKHSIVSGVFFDFKHRAESIHDHVE